MTLNRVLWVLDSELSPGAFERLCVDVLHRSDYPGIVPIGGSHDRGRDAEMRSASAPGAVAEVTFFQFSLEKDWKRKLAKELKKVCDNGHEITRYVFVTSQRVSGRDRDRLRDDVMNTYGWNLVILDREWLRLQLEEVHPDLAERYMGIPVQQMEQRFVNPAEGIATGIHGDAWRSFHSEDFESACVDLKRWLAEHPESAPGWQALAWSQYRLFRYKEALVSIERSLGLDPSDEQALSVRACILAEYGISQDVRASVLEASEIFSRIAADNPSWVAHYNYANTLVELGEHEMARNEYLRALQLESGEVQIWKNLGSLYHTLGDHEEEMRCLDRALAIDPNHPIALYCKGVSLAFDIGDAENGISYIEKALSLDENMAVHWPHAWYWLGMTKIKAGKLEQALEAVNTGIRVAPEHSGLRDLKECLLLKLWKQEPKYQVEAARFLDFQLRVQPLAYDTRAELSVIHEASGNEESAWLILAEAYKVMGMSGGPHLSESGFTLEECRKALRYLPYYAAFRKHIPVSDYLASSGLIRALNRAAGGRYSDALHASLAVPFGLGCLEIEALSGKPRDADVHRVFHTISGAIERCMPRLSAILAEDLKGLGQEARISGMASLITEMGLTALLEFSRQVGWVTGIFKLEGERVDRALDRFPLNIQANVTSASVVPVNQVLKLLRE